MRAGSKNRIIMGHILFLRDSITLLTSHQIIAIHGSLASIPERSTAVYPWPVRRAAQNENSNCRWAAVSALNSNNGRTNAWNNLVKSAEIM